MLCDGREDFIVVLGDDQCALETGLKEIQMSELHENRTQGRDKNDNGDSDKVNFDLITEGSIMSAGNSLARGDGR